MDKIKQNILMCEKAEEIQKDWVSTKGDWYYAEGGEVNSKGAYGNVIYENESQVKDGRIFLYGNNYGDGYKHPNDMEYSKRVWLPTQAQLQRIVFDKSKDVNATGLIDRFNDALEMWAEMGYCADEKVDPADWSMEQLWLAFVMKEKYNKKWDGEEWIEGIK